MKFGEEPIDLDAIDLQIVAILQQQGRIPLVKLGEQVGLSAPSVIERVKKLEDSGIITGYHASLDARRLGKDVTAFIGVSIGHPNAVGVFEKTIDGLADVLECHHVTGEHTVLLKVKTNNTSSLERLIGSIRSIEGVARTETMVVLSTYAERREIAVNYEQQAEPGNGRRHSRHQGVRSSPPGKGHDDA